MNILEIKHLCKNFGNHSVIRGLDLSVPEHSVFGFVGQNGAGKTTAFNCITGVYEPTNGCVSFYGETIVSNHPQGKMKKLYTDQNSGLYPKVVSLTPDRITKRGIARTFQNIRLFKKLTVSENVLVFLHRSHSTHFTHAYQYPNLG